MMKTPCEYCACFTCLMPFCERRVKCGKCVSKSYSLVRRYCKDVI